MTSFNTWSEKPTWLNLGRVRLKRWSIRKIRKLSIDDTQHTCSCKTSHTYLFTSWFNTCLKIIPENVIPGIPLFTSLCIDQEVRSFKLSIFTFEFIFFVRASPLLFGYVLHYQFHESNLPLSLQSWSLERLYFQMVYCAWRKRRLLADSLRLLP